jgi:deoxyuridine 5'-triphosphate nucleotidohydrolase
MQLKAKKIYADSILPTKSHSSDAGFDVYSHDDIVIQPGESAVIDLGVAIDIPRGYFSLMHPRSGLSIKKSTIVLANVIDAGYRGTIHLVVVNGGKDSWEVSKGDRVAQFVVVPIPECEIEEVEEFEGETTRGENGLGSTGA